MKAQTLKNYRRNIVMYIMLACDCLQVFLMGYMKLKSREYPDKILKIN